MPTNLTHSDGMVYWSGLLRDRPLWMCFGCGSKSSIYDNGNTSDSCEQVASDAISVQANFTDTIGDFNIILNNMTDSGDIVDNIDCSGGG